MNITHTYRMARKEDIPEVLDIYNSGIAERIATFETDPRTEADIEKWLESGFPFVVAQSNGKVEAFAATFPYSSRLCYSGIAEFSVYVDKECRGKGLGKHTMQYLVEECERKGFWKLVSRVFTDNIPSRNMLKSVGFREVGVYRAHGKLDGKWLDTVIVEYIIPKNVV